MLAPACPEIGEIPSKQPVNVLGMRVIDQELPAPGQRENGLLLAAPSCQDLQGRPCVAATSRSAGDDRDHGDAEQGQRIDESRTGGQYRGVDQRGEQSGHEGVPFRTGDRILAVDWCVSCLLSGRFPAR